MTNSTNGASEAHVEALTGAYALDALDPLERARVERHLEGCETCAAEVRSFSAAAARLAAGAATHPPPALRARVLEQAGRTRQLPPEVPVWSVRGRTTRASTWLAASAAALAVLAGSLGVIAWSERREADQAQRLAAALSEVLTDPGREVVDTEFADGRGTVLISGDRVVVLADDVPPPPPGRCFQLWFIDETGARPSDMLVPLGDERYWVEAEGLRPGDVVGVTVEPVGGSEQPTSDPVLVAPTA